MNSRYGQLESVYCMSVLLVQWPPNLLVQVFDGMVRLFGNVSHDRVNHLALVIPFLALYDILGRNSSLREIDISWKDTQ